MVEEYKWSPAECKALTVRERRYWIKFLEYKQRMEVFRRSMAPQAMGR